VPAEARQPAATALAELGYRNIREEEDVVRPYHSTFLATHERLAPVRVEMHTTLVAGDASAWMRGLWLRAAKQPWRGLEVWSLSPTDYTLAVAVHAYRHRWAHLCQVLDVALILHAERAFIDWGLFVAQAHEAGVASAVRRSLALSASLCAVGAPQEVVRALQPSSVRCLFGDALLARRGVVRPRSRLLTGPYSTLLHLASDDDSARRRTMTWRRFWRPDVGAHGGAVSRVRSSLRRAGRLCVQGVVALTPRSVTEWLPAHSASSSP
jgi:hypothetical protein